MKLNSNMQSLISLTENIEEFYSDVCKLLSCLEDIDEPRTNVRLALKSQVLYIVKEDNILGHSTNWTLK
jgi:hypothetical protein